jgi:hypothetical protein
MEERCEVPNLFLLEYNDGFRGAVLMLNGFVGTLAYAGRVGGGTQACEFFLGPGGPRVRLYAINLYNSHHI